MPYSIGPSWQPGDLIPWVPLGPLVEALAQPADSGRVLPTLIKPDADRLLARHPAAYGGQGDRKPSHVPILVLG